MLKSPAEYKFHSHNHKVLSRIIIEIIPIPIFPRVLYDRIICMTDETALRTYIFVTIWTLQPTGFKQEVVKSILLIKFLYKSLNRYNNFAGQPMLIIDYNWHRAKEGNIFSAKWHKHRLQCNKCSSETLAGVWRIFSFPECEHGGKTSLIQEKKVCLLVSQMMFCLCLPIPRHTVNVQGN